MRRTLVPATTVVLFATIFPAAADTLSGRVNTTTTQVYAFTMVGDGEVGLTLSWFDGRADLVMTLVCGDAEPLVFGSATGGSLNRLARITAGVPTSVPCQVGVTASRNGSKYYLNVMQHVDSAIVPRGRINQAAAEQPGQASHLTTAVTDQLAKLVRMRTDELALDGHE